MLPALVALRPALKYGLMVGIPVALFGGGYVTGCTNGERNVHQEWDASIAMQAAKVGPEVIKAQAMESAVVKQVDVRQRDIRQRTNSMRNRKVAHDKTIVLSPATVRLHDELRGLSEQTGDRLSDTDPRAGTSQVPPGGMGSAVAEVVQGDDGDAIELTHEELRQAVIDFYERYALLRNQYRGFSEWNDGRERLEKARYGMEASHE